MQKKKDLSLVISMYISPCSNYIQIAQKTRRECEKMAAIKNIVPLSHNKLIEIFFNRHIHWFAHSQGRDPPW